MYGHTLNSIISYLPFSKLFSTLLDKGSVGRHKKVAMTSAYLVRKLGGLNHVMIMLFTFVTFVNIFIKYHEIHSQNKLIIIQSLTLEHSHNCLEYRKIHFLDARM